MVSRLTLFLSVGVLSKEKVATLAVPFCVSITFKVKLPGTKRDFQVHNTECKQHNKQQSFMS